MPYPSDEPLHRTTVNLFTADVLAMRQFYGRDWTVKVRELVKDHLRTLVVREGRVEYYTHEDLND